MEKVLMLLTIQGLLGAFDNLWHHELKEKLPSKRSARFELTLHTTREFIYAVIFFLLAWYECRGNWAVFLTLLLMIEVIVTIWDFLEEDRTRKLPALERVLHTVLAINFGFLLAIITPYLVAWSELPTSLVPVDYGIWSWVLTVYSLGVFLWGIRDLIAVIKLGGPPTWKRRPFIRGHKTKPRTILVTGATGFIGQSLCRTLIKNGDKVITLTRDYEKANDLFGPNVKIITNLDQLNADQNLDAIVSLAGAPVIGGLWTQKRKKLLIESRVTDLNNIRALCKRLNVKPKSLVNASGIGFYGIREDELISEDASRQDIFQSRLCVERESAALAMQELGIRVCNLRIGLVFDKDGGAFPSMLRPIQYGLGAIFGDGKQWISWIYKPDLIRVILFALSQEYLSGAINATSPTPLTNRKFTYALAKCCKRPVLFKIPAFVFNSLLGELAQLFISGQRVIPEKLLKSGFRFNQPALESMLDAMDMKTNARSLDDVKIYFNESCPVCRIEISHYKNIASSLNCPMQFNDINRDKNLLSEYQLNNKDLKRRLYVHDEHGNLVSGIDAFIAIWNTLPQYQWLSRLFRKNPFYMIGSMTYEYFMVPMLALFNATREKWSSPQREAL